MQYGGKIIAGLIVFVVLLTAPFWYNVVGASYKEPKLQMPAAPNDKACVEDVEFMRTSHMKLLDQWRDWAIRDGKRIYVNSHGKEYVISLQNTCMKCHDNKEQFCDKCHDAASVNPYCWDCHIAPKGK